MYRSALLFSSLKTTVYLFFISSAILIPGRVYAAQMDTKDNPDKSEISTEAERFTDFTDGEVEKITGGMIILDDTEYIFTEKTEFTNMGGASITSEDIQQGDVVRIIFDPIDNNTLTKAILQEKAENKMPQVSPPHQNQKHTPDVIRLKNGVYSN